MKNILLAIAGSLSLTACCVARGTLVSTPRGRRPVEEMQEQDALWSIDPVTGERVSSPLLAVRRLVSDGVAEVFDLTVQHDLHNFVADDVLVHNKSPQDVTCVLPDGGMTLPGVACTGDARHRRLLARRLGTRREMRAGVRAFSSRR